MFGFFDMAANRSMLDGAMFTVFGYIEGMLDILILR